MTIVGPTQPYSAHVQENFRAMIDHVLTYQPDCPPQLAKRRLNTRLRQLLDRRMWAGLLVRGQMIVPANYTTGTVAVTIDSQTVTGTATAWPHKDKVDTTLSTAITVTGEVQDITPASMTNIEQGDWLVFDGGNAGQEFILVLSTSTSTFKACPTLAHAGGITIWKSSLSRRQFRVGMTSSWHGIKGVLSATSLYLDIGWGHSSASGQGYTIAKVYYAMPPRTRMVWSLVNNSQGWKIKLNIPQPAIDAYDVWRQTTGFVHTLVDYIPDEIGRFQYELYPSPTSEQGFPYLAYFTPDALVEDTDTPPPGIPSHVLVDGAIADVLVYNPKSAYYDPATAKKFELDFERDIQAAMLADDSVYMTNLQWAYSRYPLSAHGAAFYQQCDVDSSFGLV